LALARRVQFLDGMKVGRFVVGGMVVFGAVVSVACSGAESDERVGEQSSALAVASPIAIDVTATDEIACVDEESGTEGICTNDGFGGCIDETVGASATSITAQSGGLQLLGADAGKPKPPTCPKVECPMKDVYCAGTAPSYPVPARRTDCVGNKLPSECTYADPSGTTHGSGSGVCAATRSCTKVKRDGKIIWVAPTCGCFPKYKK